VSIAGARSVLGIAVVFIAVASLYWLFKDDAKTAPASSVSKNVGRLEKDPAHERAGRVAVERPAERARSQEAANEQSDELDDSRDDGFSDRFNDGRLQDLGYSDDTIQYIRRLWVDYEDGEEAIDEQAARGNWKPATTRYVGIKEELRIDLGDELYEAMLYATDQPNRAKVGKVVRTSPAAAAGLRMQDVVLSYDGERVFHPSDVARLSRLSDPEHWIELWIGRDGEELQVEVQGGPLGVRYYPLKEAFTRE